MSEPRPSWLIEAERQAEDALEDAIRQYVRVERRAGGCVVDLVVGQRSFRAGDGADLAEAEWMAGQLVRALAVLVREVVHGTPTQAEPVDHA